MTDLIKAYQEENRDIVFEDYEGPKFIKRSGSRAWRNNNPGNIERGNYAKEKGAIGDDGRFAVFPNYDRGRSALEDLLKSKNYRELKISDAMKRYAPSHENDTESYIKFIEQKSSTNRNTKMKDLSQEGIKAFADAIERYEGNIEGETVPLPRRKPVFDATGRIIK